MSRAGGPAVWRTSRLPASALPACLGELSRPVAGLWYLGDPSALEGAPARHVAIVGTREASPYGIRTAERLAAACAKAGLVVVSGLARGVDAAAHRAAIEAGGATIGVQGTGVDVPYPASHRSLHETLVGRGTVLSEMEPGTLATPGCFPRRNRIIAALSAVTVVVEAGYKSGAINTATQALDLGRIVAGVPGRIDEDRAAGVNRLIRDGAQVIGDVDDLLGLFQLSTSCAQRTLGSVAATAGRVDQIGWSDGESSAEGTERHPEPSPLLNPIDDVSAPFRLHAERILKGELSGQIRRDGYSYRSGG